MSDVVGHASLMEILWLIMAVYAFVQSSIKLARSNESRLMLKKRKLNGIRKRIVHGHIRSEVGRLMLYLGAIATGVYAMTRPSAPINWFAVGTILVLLYKTWDTHMANRDVTYITRALEAMLRGRQQ